MAILREDEIDFQKKLVTADKKKILYNDKIINI